MEESVISQVLDSPQGMAPQPVPTSEDDSYVAKLVEWFEDAEEATVNARKNSERNRDYYDGKQLTAAELASLRARGQPDIIINRIQPKIDYLLGYEASTRTDPRGLPRNPQDEDAAEACTDALRFVEDDTQLDQKFSNVWENMLIEGYGGVELIVDNTETGDIRIEGWDWDRLFYDPHSRKPDFSDARYLGGVIWMDADDAMAQYPDAAEAIERTVTSSSSLSETYDDRPWQRWVSGRSRKRVRIVQMYHKDQNVWKWCIFTKGGKINGGDVPFVDERGQSFCPMFLQSAYVNRDNERYGLVNIMIGPQDEITKRRSKALHMLTVKQVVLERGAVDDVEMLRTELAKPDGVIERNPGFELEINRDDQNIAGHLNLLQEAKNEIELIGPNSAMLGKQGGDPSGRAILANQQGGQTELSRLLDRHRNLKHRVFKGIWSLIRQYKTAEWWVRVTDDEKKVKFVGMNRPVTVAEDLINELRKTGAPDEEIAAAEQQIQMQMQDPIAAAQLQQVARVENVPADMEMDITVEQVPDVANLAAEQFQALTELAKAGVVFPPKTYIKASSLRNKQELLEELEPKQDPQAEAAAALQQEAIMAELEKLRAEIDKLKADTIKTLVEADMAANPMGQITEPQIDSGGAPPGPPVEQMPAEQIPA